VTHESSWWHPHPRLQWQVTDFVVPEDCRQQLAGYVAVNSITWASSAENKLQLVCRRLLGCDSVRTCRWLPTFRRNESPLSSETKWSTLGMYVWRLCVLCDVGNQKTDYMASQASRPQSTSSTLTSDKLQLLCYRRDNCLPQYLLGSASTDEDERHVTSRLPAGTAWLTAKRYRGFPDKVPLHKTKTSTYLHHIAIPAGSRQVTVAFNLISECSAPQWSELNTNVSTGGSLLQLHKCEWRLTLPGHIRQYATQRVHLATF
jgi:hypothetical protein